MMRSDNPSPLAARLPSASVAQVWLDFDGTISQIDTLDELVLRFAVDDSWKKLIDRYEAGEIGSRQCLSEEFALLRAERGQLEEFLDEIPVDPGFASLMELLRLHRVPVAILSDGIDWFIRRVLGRAGADDCTLRANTLSLSDRQVRLVCPHSYPTCTSAAAHCKCASAQSLLQPGRKTIYVGDGRSDLCPALKADSVFAKAGLARNLNRQGFAFISFSTLQDVADTLRAAWGKPE